MRINGIDIAVYGARQQNVEMGYAEIANSSEWPEGRASPMMLPGTVGFKKIRVGIILKGDSRADIWSKGSQLLSQLIQPCVVSLDGFNNNFYVFLRNVSQAEQSIKRWHKATVELVGFEYGNQIVQTGINTTFEVDNPGTILTPAIIEITPSIGIISAVISGIVRDAVTGEDKPIILQNLSKDKTVIIDGETGLITEDGVNKFADVELFDLPSLLPGKNEIITDNSNMTIVIKYKPRYI